MPSATFNHSNLKESKQALFDYISLTYPPIHFYSKMMVIIIRCLQKWIFASQIQLTTINRKKKEYSILMKVKMLIILLEIIITTHLLRLTNIILIIRILRKNRKYVRPINYTKIKVMTQINKNLIKLKRLKKEVKLMLIQQKI